MNHRTHLPDEYRHPPRSSAIAVRTTPRPADSHADWPRPRTAAGHDAQVAEPIDEYFRSAVSALASRPAPSGIAPPGPDNPVRAGTGLTARAALDLFDDQLASRHLDLAARWLRATRPGLLHDRLVGSREQRRGRRGAAIHRSRAAALPLRRVLPRPRPPGRWLRSGPRRAARPRRRDHRTDRRRTAQGVRPPRPRDHPADLHDRLAPAARGRDRVRNGARRAPGHGGGVAGRRDHRLQFRRRLGEPLDGRGRDQHRAAYRLSGRADADPVRVRGQRTGHQHPHPAGLDRDDLPRPAGAASTSRPTGAISPRASTTPAQPPSSSGSSADRRFCICTRSG